MTPQMYYIVKIVGGLLKGRLSPVFSVPLKGFKSNSHHNDELWPNNYSLWLPLANNTLHLVSKWPRWNWVQWCKSIYMLPWGCCSHTHIHKHGRLWEYMWRTWAGILTSADSRCWFFDSKNVLIKPRQALLSVALAVL